MRKLVESDSTSESHQSIESHHQHSFPAGLKHKNLRSKNISTHNRKIRRSSTWVKASQQNSQPDIDVHLEPKVQQSHNDASPHQEHFELQQQKKEFPHTD
jgi:hypothetical protein